MATRIPIPTDINNRYNYQIPTKTTKSSNRKKKSGRTFNPQSKLKSKEESNNIDSLKVSLREECIRLASFLRQESHRPGFVR